MKKSKPLRTELTDKILEASKKDAAKQKKRLRLTDPLGPGIHVNVYIEGRVVFSVEYKLAGFTNRLHVKIGEWPEMSIQEAREIAALVRELGLRGVDVQAGLHNRLTEELKRDGLDWRYSLSPPPKRRG